MRMMRSKVFHSVWCALQGVALVTIAALLLPSCDSGKPEAAAESVSSKPLPAEETVNALEEKKTADTAQHTSAPQAASTPSSSSVSSPRSISSSCSIPSGEPILKPLGVIGIKSVWKVKTSGSPCTGQKVTLTFSAKSDAGWHLFSSKSDGEIVYLPTTFILNSANSAGVKLAGEMKDGSPPEDEQDEIMGGLSRHYENGATVTFTQDLSITANDPCIAGELTGQVCSDEGMCIPLKLKFEWRPGPGACN